MAKGDGVTVLFLGSGFTRGMEKARKKNGVAVQSDFLGKVLGKVWKRRINADELEVNKTPFSDWMCEIKDPEICMSHLHNLAYSDLAAGNGKRRHAAKKAIINFRSAVKEYFRESNGNLNVDRRAVDAFRDKLQIENKIKSRSLIILTTNYDLVAEKYLCQWRCGYPEIPGGDFRNKRIPWVPLFKLHGSISWMEKRRFDGNELIGNEPLCVIDDKGRWTIGKKAHKGYWVYSPKPEVYSTPILIPFFFQKEEWLGQRWSEIFHRHWASARCSLLENQIDEMFFIGCKPPPADTYLMSWLVTVLQEIKRKRRKVPPMTIVHGNPCGEPIEIILGPYRPKKICRCGLRRYLGISS